VCMDTKDTRQAFGHRMDTFKFALTPRCACPAHLGSRDERGDPAHLDHHVAQRNGEAVRCGAQQLRHLSLLSGHVGTCSARQPITLDDIHMRPACSACSACARPARPTAPNAPRGRSFPEGQALPAPTEEPAAHLLDST
jgi:hypothetical protein